MTSDKMQILAIQNFNSLIFLNVHIYIYINLVKTRKGKEPRQKSKNYNLKKLYSIFVYISCNFMLFYSWSSMLVCIPFPWYGVGGLSYVFWFSTNSFQKRHTVFTLLWVTPLTKSSECFGFATFSNICL